MMSGRARTGLGVGEGGRSGSPHFVLLGLGAFGRFALSVMRVDFVASAVDGTLLHRTAHFALVAHALSARIQRPGAAILVGDASIGTGGRAAGRQSR